MPAARLIAIALLSAVVAVAPAAAQSAVRVGQTVSGTLAPTDPKLEDGSHHDDFMLRGARSQRLSITLKSADFDAYLAIGQRKNGEYEEIDTDDDGAGGTNARLLVTLPSDGEYVVRVNSLAGGATGKYALTVSPAAPARPLAATPIRVGQSVAGALAASDAKMADGSFYDLYRVQAKRGQPLAITLTSEAFDAYLSVGSAKDGEFDAADSDDDGAGGQNAMVVFEAPADGEYLIRANSLSGGKTGAYTLAVRPGDASQRPAAPRVAMERGREVAARGSVRVGQTVSGSLDASDRATFDGTFYEDWLLTGTAGEKVAVTLRSREFDAYLQFGRNDEGKFDYIEAQDDGAGGNDSLLEVTLPVEGQYVLRVNTLFAATGAYTLQVARGR